MIAESLCGDLNARVDNILFLVTRRPFARIFTSEIHSFQPNTLPEFLSVGMDSFFFLFQRVNLTRRFIERTRSFFKKSILLSQVVDSFGPLLSG